MSKHLPTIFSMAEQGDIAGLEAALRDADVNAKDEFGMTPLHYAAASLNMEAVELLLAQRDVDATVSDKFGRTAASIAVEGWDELSDEIVNKLNPHCYPWLFTTKDI